MVAVHLTPEIESLLISTNLSHQINTTATTKTVSHKTLCNALGIQKEQSPSLYSLLQHSTIHLTHRDAIPSVSTRNAQVEARVQKLRARQAEAEYTRMTRDVSRLSGMSAELESLRMSKLAPQMSLGLNVVVSMGTCFAAGYFVGKGAAGNDTVGLIGGITGMIVAMLVEAVLLGIRMYTIEEKADSQRRARANMAAPKE